MPTPDRKTFALAFLQLASPHDGPPRVAGEHAPTGLNLVVEVHRSKELGDPAENNDLESEPPRVDILTVKRDVPPAGENEASARRGEVEHRLSRLAGVPVDTSRHEHGDHTVAPGYRLLDDLAVVRRPGYDGYGARELVEFRDALFTAYADHLIAAVERVLHDVLSGLPRGPDDADLHRTVPPVRQPLSGKHANDNGPSWS